MHTSLPQTHSYGRYSCHLAAALLPLARVVIPGERLERGGRRRALVTNEEVGGVRKARARFGFGLALAGDGNTGEKRRGRESQVSESKVTNRPLQRKSVCLLI